MARGAVTLAGKRVLVTGASGGVGRAVVENLVDGGCAVAASGRDINALDALHARWPDRVSAVQADLAAPRERDELVGRAVEALGGLDALVQCAGVVRYEPVWCITESALSEQVAVNQVAPLRLAQGFARHVHRDERGGSIVNVASTLAMRPAPQTAAYGATKAALLSLTQSLALELGAWRVRVNAVAPGVVDTEMVRVPRLSPKEAEPTGVARQVRIDAQLRDLTDLHPMGRIATAHDVASSIRYLLEAPFVTGTVLTVDGGLLAG